MKRKLFIILFIVLVLPILTIKPQKTYAQQNTDIKEQIQFLLREIDRLQKLIAILQSQQEINAQSYLVTDLSDNSVFLEKNNSQILPIASVTKLMTATIATENINLNKTITLQQEMLTPLGYSPSLYLGLNVSAQNLIKASLIQSTNDAAFSLTYFLESGKFLNLMNQKAKELGMINTVFYDPHGLSPTNNSTASDLTKLLTYIYKNHPEILTITKDNNFWLPDQSGRLLRFKNVNNFYDFPEFIGGKTGYIPEAKQTIAEIFIIKGKPKAVVLLYSNNRQNDILSILNPIKSAVASQ